MKPLDRKPIRGPLAARSRDEIVARIGSIMQQFFEMHGRYFQFPADFDAALRQPLTIDEHCPVINVVGAFQRNVFQIQIETQIALRDSHREQLDTIVKAWRRWARGGVWRLRLAAKQPYAWPEFTSRPYAFRPGRPLTSNEIFYDPIQVSDAGTNYVAELHSYAASVMESVEAAAEPPEPGSTEGDVFDALRIVSYDHVSASASVALYCASMVTWCNGIVAEAVARYRDTGLWFEPIFAWDDCPRGRYWDRPDDAVEVP